MISDYHAERVRRHCVRLLVERSEYAISFMAKLLFSWG